VPFSCCISYDIRVPVVYCRLLYHTSKKSDERQGATHHGGAGDVLGASEDSPDSQEAPRKLHDNNGVLGIGTMVALKTPHDVQKIFLVVCWRGKV
jgi:hypothetical protein